MYNTSYIVDGSDEPPTCNLLPQHLFTMVIPVTSIQLEHIPRPHSVHLALFKNVQNAAFLRDQLLAGNTDFEYAFIDATTVSESASYHTESWINAEANR